MFEILFINLLGKLEILLHTFFLFFLFLLFSMQVLNWIDYISSDKDSCMFSFCLKEAFNKSYSKGRNVIIIFVVVAVGVKPIIVIIERGHFPYS